MVEQISRVLSDTRLAVRFGESMKMKKKMTFEEYKREVFHCLTNSLDRTIPVADRLMKDHEADLQRCFDENLDANAAAVGMAMNLL